MAYEDFLQEEDGRLCLHRKGSEEDIHFVCHAELVVRHVPESAEDRDDAQDRLYAEDLEEKIQRMVDERLDGGGGGPMVPPLSSAQERGNPLMGRQAPSLPEFGRQDYKGHGGHDYGLYRPPNVGATNQQVGIREEKWPNLDLKCPTGVVFGEEG